MMHACRFAIKPQTCLQIASDMLNLAADLVEALDSANASGSLSHHSILVFLPTSRSLEQMYQLLNASGEYCVLPHAWLD